MSNIEVIGLGALNIDHIYKVKRILEDGEAVIDEAGIFPGGSAANTIYGLAKLGVSTGFVGAIGDDAEGSLMLHDFDKVGVDASQIRTKQGQRTGSTLCLSDSSSKRSIYVIPGANNHLSINDIDMAYINSANILHLSSFADDRQFQVLLELIGRFAPSVKVSFSPGELYAAKGLNSLAPIINRTYVLFANQSEIQKLTGSDSVNGAEMCLKQGCQIVVVTLSKGKRLTDKKDITTTAICYIKDTRHEYLIEPVSLNEITTVDTTGAGDAFATGFLYGYLNGKRLDECGHLGNIVAQFSIVDIGARTGLPTLTQLAQHYTKLYNQ